MLNDQGRMSLRSSYIINQYPEQSSPTLGNWIFLVGNWILFSVDFETKNISRFE
jgi:hypothetical protein